MNWDMEAVSLLPTRPGGVAVDDATRDNTSSGLHQWHAATTVLPRRFLPRRRDAGSNVLAGKAKIRNKSTWGSCRSHLCTAATRGAIASVGCGLAVQGWAMRWTWIGTYFA